MAEFPALPIFTDAFIADTLHLNALQTGAYFMLLMVAWRTKSCTLPDDDDKLASFARMDKRTWMKNKHAIMSFWHRNSDGEFYQKRLSDERKLAEHIRDQAVQAGKASALKRKERHSTDVPTELQRNVNYPKPNPNPCKPPLPPLGGAPTARGFGFLGEGNNEKPFRIENFLSDADRERAKANAPGWDLQYLMRTYDEGINDGSRERPKKSAPAFIAWCKSYTKGKRP